MSENEQLENERVELSSQGTFDDVAPKPADSSMQTLESESWGAEEESLVESDDEYEVIELEYSEDEVEYYIEDEDGVEVGLAVKDEQGNVVEYYYEDDPSAFEEVAVAPSEGKPSSEQPASAPLKKASDKPKKSQSSANEDSLAYMAGSAAVKLRSKAEKAPEKISEVAKKAKPAVSKNELKETAADLNDIVRTGKEISGELKSTYDDLAGMLEFLPKTPKGRKFGRR